jgi:hypothetical protein
LSNTESQTPLGNDKYKWNKKPKATTEETTEFDTD